MSKKKIYIWENKIKANRYSKDNIVAVFSLVICIFCVCGMSDWAVGIQEKGKKRRPKMKDGKRKYKRNKRR